jgi:hypothetical protein
MLFFDFTLQSKSLSAALVNGTSVFMLIGVQTRKAFAEELTLLSPHLLRQNNVLLIDGLFEKGQ